MTKTGGYEWDVWADDGGRVPERPLPRRMGGPLPPQPCALWSPASEAQERLVFAAVLHYLKCPTLMGTYGVREAHEIITDIAKAALRREGVPWK